MLLCGRYYSEGVSKFSTEISDIKPDDGHYDKNGVSILGYIHKYVPLKSLFMLQYYHIFSIKFFFYHKNVSRVFEYLILVMLL